MEKTSPRLCLLSQVQRLNFGVWLRGCGAARCQPSREEFPTWGRVRLGHPQAERGFFLRPAFFSRFALKEDGVAGSSAPFSVPARVSASFPCAAPGQTPNSRGTSALMRSHRPLISRRQPRSS